MIKAIETRYAGHLFRSRLEARWAHAFDLMGIRWEYESQGYMVGNRLSWNGPDDTPNPDCWNDGKGCSGCLTESWPYLPDFWLPDLRLFAEVKGTFDSFEALIKFLDASASLSAPESSCNQHDPGDPGHDMVLLGPLSGQFRMPYGLHMHKGELQVFPWKGQENGLCRTSGTQGHWTVADDGGGLWDPRASAKDRWREFAPNFLAGAEPSTGLLRSAMMSAAQARFEHGETPEPPRR